MITKVNLKNERKNNCMYCVQIDDIRNALQIFVRGSVATDFRQGDRF